MAALLSSPGVAPGKEPCAPSTLSVTVGGLACEGCARAAQKAVLGVAGVVRCAVSLGGDVDVEWSGPEPVQLQSLVFALESVGLFVTRPFEAPGCPLAALLEELRDTPSARRYRCGCGCADCICAAQPVWQGDAGRDVTLEALCARLERSADLAALGASGLAATLRAGGDGARRLRDVLARTSLPCGCGAAPGADPLRDYSDDEVGVSESKPDSPVKPPPTNDDDGWSFVGGGSRSPRRSPPRSLERTGPRSPPRRPPPPLPPLEAPAISPPASPEPRSEPASPASPAGGGSTPGRRRHKAPKRQKSPRKAPAPRAFDDAALTDAAAAATRRDARSLRGVACACLAGALAFFGRGRRVFGGDCGALFALPPDAWAGHALAASGAARDKAGAAAARAGKE